MLLGNWHPVSQSTLRNVLGLLGTHYSQLVYRPAGSGQSIFPEQWNVEGRVPGDKHPLRTAKGAPCTQKNPLVRQAMASPAACSIRGIRRPEKLHLSRTAFKAAAPLYHLCMLLQPLSLKKLYILNWACWHLCINHVTIPFWQSYTF